MFIQQQSKEKCINCNKYFMKSELIGIYCKSCFKEKQEKIPIEERILALEIGLIHSYKHEHLENMRF